MLVYSFFAQQPLKANCQS